jgi:hypothetical protein
MDAGRSKSIAARVRTSALIGLAAAFVASIVVLSVSLADDRSGAVPWTPARSTGSLVVAVGDIACEPALTSRRDRCAQVATAAVARELHPDAVLPLGDTQYDSGSAGDYASAYAPTWGQFLSISHPVPGNHEYQTMGAAGYFGTSAGAVGQGWYSFDISGWHVVALNAECGSVGGCGPGSAQDIWLRADLAASSARCTLAYWHEPRFSDGEHGPNAALATLWADLAAVGADVILSGHDHDYERTKPLDGSGQPVVASNGMVEFVVGTGGKSLYPFLTMPSDQVAVRDNRTFGVLALVLRPAGYDYAFLPAADGHFTDRGTSACH